MAVYTDIPNSSLSEGAPIRSVDGKALRDNPIAIAEGAVGAPRIQNAGIEDGTIGAEKFQTGQDEIDWVRLMNQGVQAYDLGSYIFAVRENTTTAATNGVVAGSQLRPVSMSLDTGSFTSIQQDSLVRGSYSGTGIAGTWRCMGYAFGQSIGGSYRFGATLWLRIS